jgi:putative ABC transport system ATP-binding protein
MNEPAVHTTGLSKVYGSGDARVVAVDNVTVAFPRGRFTAVMGPSGSGKSTMMHCLAGLDRPTGGQVFLGGTEISTLSDTRLTAIRRDRVGFVFQAFNLLPTLTAWENIVLPLDLAGRRPDQRFADLVIDSIGLRHRLGHRPDQLSGGQQQRVACARALITRPDVVFADEPTGALDSRSSVDVMEFLRRSVDELGQTVVMVTHDPAAAAYADDLVQFADGRVISHATSGTPGRVSMSEVNH